MDMNENDIISACRSGDLNRFTELYDQHIDQIYRFIYYKTQHTETAEDLTSLTWLKALENIRSFKGGSFKSWLYRIARNTVIDHYRTKRFDQPVEDAWDIPSQERPATDAANRDLIERVRTDLQRLPVVQRDVLMLRLWEGCAYKEISELVGQSENNCKVIVSRALAKLRSETLASFLLLSLTMIHSVKNI